MLNVNEMAKDYDFYNVAGRDVSPDNKVLAFGEDTLSRRIYTLKFKNLETGEFYPEEILNTTGGAVWAADSKNSLLHHQRSNYVAPGEDLATRSGHRPCQRCDDLSRD